MSKRKFGQDISAAFSSAASNTDTSKIQENVWRCNRNFLPGLERCVEIKRNTLEKNENYYLNAMDCRLNCTVPNDVTREILNYLDRPALTVVQSMYSNNMPKSLGILQTKQDDQLI